MFFVCMLKIEETEIMSCPHLTVILMHYPLMPCAHLHHFYTSFILYPSAAPYNSVENYVKLRRKQNEAVTLIK